jgi:hypothetical protein
LTGKKKYDKIKLQKLSAFAKFKIRKEKKHMKQRKLIRRLSLGLSVLMLVFSLPTAEVKASAAMKSIVWVSKEGTCEKDNCYRIDFCKFVMGIRLRPEQ